MSKEQPALLSPNQNSLQPSTILSGYLDNGASSLAGESNGTTGTNELSGTKYKFFYNRLYKCLCFLEEENRKLLQAVQNKVRVSGEPKCLEELLDEFAFKVAKKKDVYETSQTAQATSEGQQAFMAKRWKMRYHNLLDLAQIFQKKLENIDGEKIKYVPNKDQELNADFFDEALGLPWDPKVNFEDALRNAVDDIAYNAEPVTGRQASTYEFNDFTIPISSVFIQDLLANHNRCVEQINNQNEIKCRLFHVLKKTKEQRNQLKKYVMEQENEIQFMESKIKDIEDALRNREKELTTDAGTKLDEKKILTSPSSSDNSPEHTPQEHEKVDALEAEVKMLELRKRELEGMLAEEEQQRRRLSRRLQDLVGTIHVSCRIRPHPNNYLQVVSDDKLLFPKSLPAAVSKPNGLGYTGTDQMRCFIFEKVLGPGTGHYEIFKKLGQPLTQCLDGHNLCVMTYGPRKSGKTFTMFGNGPLQKSIDSTEITKGIAQDAVHLLLSLARQRTAWSYDIQVSALSVNDDGITDLLKDNKCSLLKTVKSTMSTLEDDELSTQHKAVQLTVGSDFDNLVQSVRETQMRKTGHSTHLIIKLVIEGYQKSAKEVTVHSTLLLADLASWEKRFNTDELEMVTSQSTPDIEPGYQSTPTTTKVSTGVNQSLLALSRVFTALRKRKVPAFRDSMLTQMLRPVLSGDSKCFLIITINSDPNEFTSTLASLQFAQNAMQATTKLVADHRPKLGRGQTRRDSLSK
ncbi:Kinesin family member C1 [Fasciolopsis buskii]|uniref:Kinesin family member C1 n=1 Tax=Fasciolopsis buskii TaxID=27845 RepID=A0A8E0RJD1_9TREM|nr:Kinesin family member C1 [Fasciolopsis buski]